MKAWYLRKVLAGKTGGHFEVKNDEGKWVKVRVQFVSPPDVDNSVWVIMPDGEERNYALEGVRFIET